MMESEGFLKKNFEEEADIYVINTCSVTENADKECRHLVRRVKRKAPSSLVVITGCYAQLKPESIAQIEGVDIVLGAAEKFNLATHLHEYKKEEGTKICSCDIADVTDFTGTYSFTDRTRTFLKVQDGCSYNCSFCTIPMARGKSRSDSLGHVLQTAWELGEKGVKEIVLTGVNLGDFKDDSGNNFFELAKKLDEVETIERFRISSIEPNLLSEEIIDFVAGSERFMPHFHVPLQSGSNKILGLMRRRYRRELYADRVTAIKKAMPHACIGVDVIVGFPDESEADFNETLKFLHDLDVSYFHVFTYSERDQTHALTIQPVVPIQVRHERNKVLRNLSYQKTQFFNEAHRGQTRKVLWEGANKLGMMEGFTDNYIKLKSPYKKEWENTIMDWVI